MQNETKRTWAEIRESAIRHNLETIRTALPEGCRVCGVVKANAYGHGAVEAAQMLERARCDWLSVATLDEAEQLRQGGVSLPILILSHTPAEFIERVVKADFVQALGSPEAAEESSRALEKAGQKLRVHIKLETGMGRTGFDVKNGDVKSVVEAMSLPGIVAEGIFSHFASSEDPHKEEYSLRQLELFTTAVAKIEQESGGKFALKHCANTGAVISYPQASFDMVRCGISLYGVSLGQHAGALGLEPVMALKTRVIQVYDLNPGESVSYGSTFTADRKMKIAVLPIGYADGLHRVLSNKMDVLIGGRRCRQVGTICMDMCMADVSGVDDARLGDVAVIFGRDGSEEIFVNELAEKAGTISYEMLCAVSPRVPRVYLD